MKRKRPQLYPTRHFRSFFNGCLGWLDRIPVLKSLVQRSQDEPSDVPVSILMPLHEKDLWIAPHSVASLRKNLLHPIEEVVVVSARNEKIQQWCEEDGLRWLDESEILDWNKESIGNALPDWAKSRDGWLFQQLLKLSFDQFCLSDSVLVVDADTLLLRKRAFVREGKVRLDFSHERNLLYLQTYEALLGRRPSSWASFVAHHIFMEKEVLQAMKKGIETHTGKSWDKAIIEFASSDIWTENQRAIYPFNYFSEYETYGNFCKSYYGKVKSRYFWNYSCKAYSPKSLDVEGVVAEIPSVYSWISFHSYNKED